MIGTKYYIHVFNVRVATVLIRRTKDRKIAKEFPWEAVLLVGKKRRITYRHVTREELINSIKCNAGWTCEVI